MPDECPVLVEVAAEGPTRVLRVTERADSDSSEFQLLQLEQKEELVAGKGEVGSGRTAIHSCA